MFSKFYICDAKIAYLDDIANLEILPYGLHFAESCHLLKLSKIILCGVVYRPPQQCNFYNFFEDMCIAHSDFIEKESNILGDFNTDVTKSRRCNLVKSLFDVMNMFNFSQIISDVTRVSKTSSTTIDLILVSDTDKISQRDVLDLGISDHCLIYCTRKVLRNTINSHNTVKIRSLKITMKKHSRRIC